MREHLIEICFDEMTMSVLINVDEVLYSASSCNVILEEKKKAKQLWQQDRNKEKNNKKKIYIRLLPVANVAIRFIAFFRVFTDIEFFSSFFET